MKNLRNLFILFISIIALNSCSKEDNPPPCPIRESISIKVNGEFIPFISGGRGIDLDNDGSGHTLTLWFDSITLNPQDEPSYSIILKLPFKKDGTNVLEEFYFSRIENTTYTQGFFDIEELQSEVFVNRNTCFITKFSGTTIIEGTEIAITDGIINLIYDEPF